MAPVAGAAMSSITSLACIVHALLARAAVATAECSTSGGEGGDHVCGAALLQAGQRLNRVVPGSAEVTSEQLSELETKYGGFVQGVHRNVPAHGAGGDGYTEHQGGDRMSHELGHHDYGTVYADFINRLRLQGVVNLAIAEVGILKGSGLAIWSEVFKGGTIFGFDIDPSNYQSNLGSLVEEGFDPSRTQVQTLDQTDVDMEKLKVALAGRRLSMLVDDGCHTEACARNTFVAFRPYMADRFVYFIEDGACSPSLQQEIKQGFPELSMETHGPMIVIFRL